MMRRNADFTVERESADGGLGNFEMRHLITRNELPPHVRLICEVIIEPGEICASHQHVGDTEIYYILSGKAEYEGAEGTSILEPGDATVCYDGESHAIKCLGDETLKFLAFIPFTR